MNTHLWTLFLAILFACALLSMSSISAPAAVCGDNEALDEYASSCVAPPMWTCHGNCTCIAATCWGGPDCSGSSSNRQTCVPNSPAPCAFGGGALCGNLGSCY